MNDLFFFFRPPSAQGGVSARLGSHRPESRAYGNFDHQQAIHTNRHGNLLVLITHCSIFDNIIGFLFLAKYSI
jgi:hypothetical protein